jgi:hypothetical protein
MQNLIYDSKQPLTCSPCSPCNTRSDVIICLDSDKVLNGAKFIEGVLISGPSLQSCSSGSTYRHVITYNETDLTTGLPITSSDVKGVICKGCWTDYVETVERSVFTQGVVGGDGTSGEPIKIKPGALNTTLITDSAGVVRFDVAPALAQTPISLVETNTISGTVDGVSDHRLTINVKIDPALENTLIETPNGILNTVVVAPGSGMTNFTVSGDTGPTQSITEGDNLKVFGQGLIETVASATDTLTVVLTPGENGQVLRTVAGEATWTAETPETPDVLTSLTLTGETITYVDEDGDAESFTFEVTSTPDTISSSHAVKAMAFVGTSLVVDSAEMPVSLPVGSPGSYDHNASVALNSTVGSPTYPATVTIQNTTGRNMNGVLSFQYAHNITQLGDCRAYRGYQYRTVKGDISGPMVTSANTIVLPEYEYINTIWQYTKEATINVRLDELNSGPLLPGKEITIELGTVVRHEVGGTMNWNLSSCAIRGIITSV